MIEIKILQEIKTFIEEVEAKVPEDFDEGIRDHIDSIKEDTDTYLSVMNDLKDDPEYIENREWERSN